MLFLGVTLSLLKPSFRQTGGLHINDIDIYEGAASLEKNPFGHLEESPSRPKYILKPLERRNPSPAKIREVGWGAG